MERERERERVRKGEIEREREREREGEILIDVHQIQIDREEERQNIYNTQRHKNKEYHFTNMDALRGLKASSWPRPSTNGHSTTLLPSKELSANCSV